MMIAMKCFLGIVLVAVCSTVHLYAQQEGVPTPAPPEETVVSPSDIPVPPPPVTADAVPPPPVVVAPLDDSATKPHESVKVKESVKSDKSVNDGGGCTCGSAGCMGGGLLACCPSKGWKLPQPCLLQKTGFAVGGWVQQGITYNAQDPASGFNGPVATNDMDMKYQLNQAWLFLHRPADNGGCGWAWGGHIDALVGTDWRFGINKGLEDRINGLGDGYQDYGMVIPQAYLEIAFNKLSVKLGHMAAILDYEVIPAPLNPFYSHSYSYGYTVPQLVTGALADYKLTDQFSVQAGVHRGWMQFEDFNDNVDIMAGIKWTSCDKATSLAYAINTGKQSFPFDDQNRFVYSLVLQQKLTDRLKYVLVHNAGIENDTRPYGVDIPRTDAEWYGLNQYLLYTINPCWAANLRVEWLRDDDGYRIGGPGFIPGVDAWDGGGYPGNFYEVTCGLNWRPNKNWLIRPEMRWDWYDGLTNPAGQLPFDDGASDNQFTLAVDAVLTF
jgi:hypothetical protein